MLKNTRALQSVAMSAVMAMTGWFLVMENGGVAGKIIFSKPVVHLPLAQALTAKSPPPLDIQFMSVGAAMQQTVSEDAWVYFTVTAPAHANALQLRLESLEGDADLYVREGYAPEGSVSQGGFFDASSATQGSRVEQVNLDDAADRQWYIAVHGYRASRFILSADIN